MLDPFITQLLKEDRRYPLEAYIFVFEALDYAQNVLRMGTPSPSEPLQQPAAAGQEEGAKEEEEAEGDEVEEVEEVEEVGQRHVTGQELCEAIRRFALEQYGYMAKTVLNSWGIHATADFGELVFNMIRIGRMRKTAQDCRADFDKVYDFDAALVQDYRITHPESPQADD
jgi:uncharacterized repeat protein (TIGR04138 family)